MRKARVGYFGDATGDEQRRMVVALMQLLDLGVEEFTVADDRGGTGCWKVVVAEEDAFRSLVSNSEGVRNEGRRKQLEQEIKRKQALLRKILDQQEEL